MRYAVFSSSQIRSDFCDSFLVTQVEPGTIYSDLDIKF